MAPEKRLKARKSTKQMDEEELDGESTDVWTKNIIQKYEDRPGHIIQNVMTTLNKKFLVEKTIKLKIVTAKLVLWKLPVNLRNIRNVLDHV